MDTTPDAVLVDGEWYLEYDLPITWYDDCIHYLYYRNVDYLGNLEAEHMAMFYVDGTAPVSEWGFVDDTGDQIYDEVDDFYWIDYDTRIWIECEDFGCDDGVGVMNSIYRWEWDEDGDGVIDSFYPSEQEADYGIDWDGDGPEEMVWYVIYIDGEELIWWEQDCVHYLYFLNFDYLYNIEDEWCIEFWVDGTTPESTWQFGDVGDQIPRIGDWEGDWWVDYDTEIILICEDYGCNGGVGDFYPYPTYWGMWYTEDGLDPILRPIDGDDDEYGTPVFYGEQWFWEYTDPIMFDEDCFHEIFYFNVDPLGNEEQWNWIDIWVDGTSPQSYWDFERGQFVYDEVDDFYWINYDTIIYIECEDYGCDGGVGDYIEYTTYWGIWYDDLSGDPEVWRPVDEADDEYGIPVQYEGVWFWVETDIDLILTTIQFDEDCIHELVFFNVDSLGNAEIPYSVTFKVDGTAPMSEWGFVLDEGMQIYDDIEDFYWINPDTQIWLDCTDYGCDGGVGGQITYWRYEWDEDADGIIDSYYPDEGTPDAMFIGEFWYIEYLDPIMWEEDCLHYLYFLNVDDLGNVEDENMVLFAVDGTAPISDWDFVADSGTYFPHIKTSGDTSWIDYWWVTPGTWIDLFCEDYGCMDGVGGQITYFRWEWDSNADGIIDTYYPTEADDYALDIDGVLYMEYDTSINFDDDCIHYLYFLNIDALGNVEEENMMTFKVDGTSPISEWGFVEEMGDQIYDGTDDFYWIDYDTEIWIECTDYGCDDGVGVEYTLWRYEFEGEMYPDSLTYDVEIDGVYYWIYEGPISWEEDCIHSLYFLNVDWLGNAELEWCIEFWVDGTTPESSYEITGDSFDDGGETLWIDYDTIITLDCMDYGCQGGVGGQITYFGYEWNGSWYPIDEQDTEYGTPVMYGDSWFWIYTDQEISWDEDCVHTLWFFNVDALGNEESWWYIDFYVDGTPPVIDKTVGDPKVSAGGDDWFVGGTTEISAIAWDEGCYGGVGLEYFEFRWWYLGVWTDWMEWDWENPLIFDESCTHFLELRAIDYLGHETLDNETFYVDATPPVVTKEIGQPQYWDDEGRRFVTSDTPIWLNGTDLGECQVGTYTIYYKVTWAGGEWFGQGEENEDIVLTFGEVVDEDGDCRHYLDWWAIDGIGNRIDGHQQIYYVDNTPPVTEKFWGDPTCDREDDLNFITDQTPFRFEATDEDPMRVNVMPEYYAYPGQTITLYGNAHWAETDTDHTGMATWDFGDTFGSGPSAVADQSTWGHVHYISTTHAYSVPGVYYATLNVTNATGEAWDSDTVVINVYNETDALHQNQAILDGLRYLYTSQLPTGNWDSGGSYGDEAATGIAILAFENHEFKPTDPVDSVIFAEYLQMAFDWVWMSADSQTLPISGSPEIGDCDWDGDGRGISFGTSRRHYHDPMIMLAIVGSFTPNMVIDSPNPVVNGMTYLQVLENMTQYQVWGQTENGLYRGGWHYNGNADADNSNSQWPAIAMKAAELWGIGTSGPSKTVLDASKAQNAIWTAQCQQPDGHFYYSPSNQGSSYNYASTGSGLAQLAWQGVVATDPKVTSAVSWMDSTYSVSTSKYLMYSWYKGLKDSNPQVTMIGAHDWHADFKAYLNTSQLSTGAYSGGSPNWGSVDLNTAWSILMLAEEVITTPITADAGEDQTVYKYEPVMLDGSGSHPAYAINNYIWDFDYDGVTFDEDYNDTTPIAYATYTVPGTYVAALKVWNSTSGIYDLDTTTTTVRNCASGVAMTLYRIWYNGTWYPEPTVDVSVWYDDETDTYWWIFEDDFTFVGECEHIIEFFSIDNVGNRENVHNQTHYVDLTPPRSRLVWDEPYGWCELFNLTWIEPETPLFFTYRDFGCYGGIGVSEVWFRVWYDGLNWSMDNWTEWMLFDGEFTMYDLEEYYPGISNDSAHIIEWYAVDCLGNTEETHSFTLQVDRADPEPNILDPKFDYSYRPGHIIDLVFEELTGDELVYFEWYYSFDGEEWFMIWAGLGDETTELTWDTSVIPDPLCDDGPTMVYVKLIVWDEHCRYNDDVEQIWFCRENNPQPCSQTISFSQGWNLISIAVDLNTLGGDYTASILAGEINDQAGEDVVKYIVKWNSEEQVFDEYVVKHDVGVDFPINKGEGYYVYSVSPFDVDFTIVGDCAQCETFDLEPCWNLVGWDSMESMYVGDFADIINAVAEDNVVQAIVRHVSGDSYEAWYPGDDPELFMVEPGHAYWVFVAISVNDVPLP